MSEISQRILKIVAEHLNLDEAEVNEYSNFIEDLGTDSLDAVELIMTFEDEFSCSIPDEAASKMVTVRDAIDFIKARIALSENR